MPAPLRPMCGEAERRASVAQALLLAASALLPTLAAAESAHSNSQSRSGRCRAESCERKTMRGSGWASLLMTPRMINDAENDVSAVPEIQIALSLGQRVRPDREAGMPGHRDAVAPDGLPFVFGRRGRGPLLLAAEKARQHSPGWLASFTMTPGSGARSACAVSGADVRSAVRLSKPICTGTSTAPDRTVVGRTPWTRFSMPSPLFARVRPITLCV